MKSPISSPCTALFAAFLPLLLAAAPAVAQRPTAQDPPTQGPSVQAPSVQGSSAQDPSPRSPAPFAVPDPAERGEVLAVPTVAGEAGPLFDLRAVVERLGGRLEVRRGDSWALTLGDREALFGPEIATVALGTEIYPLVEAPREVDGSLYVPLDLLEETYGRASGVTLRWDPASRTLRATRREQRPLEVATDVVHLQGVTTVVLELPRRVRYRLDRQGAGLDVVIQGDRLQPVPRRRVDDPLVDGIRVGADRISLDLVPGAQADAYTLENPFRLVFDIVRGEAGRPRPVEPRTPPPAREPLPGIRTIVLDPGHGGSETGAIGPSGVLEKELTLLLARALASRLESHLGVNVILTRDEDASLPFETRTAIANNHKADLFISLHLNSAFGPSARGAETYFLSLTASDDRAARAAEVENSAVPATPADSAAGGEDPLFDLQLILWDLAQTHHLEQSQRLATLIQGELNSTLDLRDRGVKQAPFMVLMGAAMPAVLVEAGFLSNPEEEQRLQDPAYRARLADALVRAIGRYKAEVEERPVEAPESGEAASGVDGQAADEAVAPAGPAPAAGERP